MKMTYAGAPATPVLKSSESALISGTLPLHKLTECDYDRQGWTTEFQNLMGTVRI